MGHQKTEVWKEYMSLRMSGARNHNFGKPAHNACDKIEKRCEHCEKTYFVHPYRVASRFCSVICRRLWSTGRPLVKRIGHLTSEETRRKISTAQLGKKRVTQPTGKCGHCGSGFEKNARESHSYFVTKRYCSPKCYSIAKNKGKTSEAVRCRRRTEFKLWRESVFVRDAFTCQKCKKQGGKLNAHHILNFSQHKDLRTSIANGLTLCAICHVKFHKTFGKTNNTASQLAAFLDTVDSQ